MELYLCKLYTLELNKCFDNAFNVLPHRWWALPLFDLRSTLPECVQPTGTPYESYGVGWEVQKPSGELYDIQCDKKSKK